MAPKPEEEPVSSDLTANCLPLLFYLFSVGDYISAQPERVFLQSRIVMDVRIIFLSMSERQNHARVLVDLLTLAHFFRLDKSQFTQDFYNTPNDLTSSDRV